MLIQLTINAERIFQMAFVNILWLKSASLDNYLSVKQFHVTEEIN